MKFIEHAMCIEEKRYTNFLKENQYLHLVKADKKEKEPDAFMTEQKAAGILILQYGKIRLERYALGFSDAERWTSQSVVKSFVDGMRLSGSV